jgi:hypothetical protein
LFYIFDPFDLGVIGLRQQYMRCMCAKGKRHDDREREKYILIRLYPFSINSWYIQYIVSIKEKEKRRGERLFSPACFFYSDL